MYYLVKTKVELSTEDKPISEQYLVQATSVVDAQARITELYVSQDTPNFETVSIQESKIIGVIE